MTTIKVVEQLDDQHADAAWNLYHDAFHGLDALAVQRHLMYREEFDQVVTDHRVDKYLALTDNDALCGLATFTNDLHAWPLIAPAYFARRWPGLYAQRRIWYCGFVAVADEWRSRQVFSALVKAMYTVAADQSGLIVLDICRYNTTVRHLPQVIEAMLRRLSGGQVITQRLDEQTFWLYETPQP